MESNMSSAKGKIVRFLGAMLLKHGRVTAVDDVGTGFRRIRLATDVPKPGAGTKLQVLLPSDDVRTYSPIASDAGAMILLGYKRAGGPGARWVAEVEVGAEVPFAAPGRSLSLPPGAVILVGDETSVGVAASFEVERPGQVHAVLQGESADDLRAASASVGLSRAHVSLRGDTDALVEAVVAARALSPDATVALTGGSELVLAARAALRARRIRDIKTKTYWVPGKTGLD
jgi:NADPH-dependent ferric siderophore reductase